MSLVNDALRKARREAAERDAEARGATYRPPRAHLPPERRSGVLVGLLLGLALALVAAGANWYVQTKQAARSTEPGEGEALRTMIGMFDEVEVPDPGAEPTEEPLVQTTPSGTEPSAAGSSETGPSETAPPTAQAPPSPSPTGETTSRTEDSAPPPLTAEASRAPVERRDAPSPGDPQPQRVEPVTPPPTASEPTVSAPTTAASDPSDERARVIREPARTGRVEPDIYVLEADLGDTVLRLDFIIFSPTAPFAQINGEQVAPGQIVDGWSVVTVERQQVQLRRGERDVVLRVR